MAARALNALEAALNDGRRITVELLKPFLMATLSYMIEMGWPFPSGERAQQPMRATDPDAAAYWLMRMVDAGEDPIFIARRLGDFRERRHRPQWTLELCLWLLTP